MKEFIKILKSIASKHYDLKDYEFEVTFKTEEWEEGFPEGKQPMVDYIIETLWADKDFIDADDEINLVTEGDTISTNFSFIDKKNKIEVNEEFTVTKIDEKDNQLVIDIKPFLVYSGYDYNRG